jgi:hypothetical protein
MPDQVRHDGQELNVFLNFETGSGIGEHNDNPLFISKNNAPSPPGHYFIDLSIVGMCQQGKYRDSRIATHRAPPFS